MKKVIELTEQAGTKGIQIQIAGRIDGKEIARVEWIREGRVPLQTIRAKIDYCSHTVGTIYGALGIKIWIFVMHCMSHDRSHSSTLSRESMTIHSYYLYTKEEFDPMLYFCPS